MNRSFGLLFVAVFTLLSAMTYRENGLTYIIWAGLALLFLLITASVPRVLAPLRRLWMRIGQALSHVMNPLVLGIVYVAVIIPVAGLMLLFRRDVLARTPDAGADSYWIARQGQVTDLDSLKEQF